MARFVLIGGPFQIVGTQFSGEAHTELPLGSVLEMPEELAHGAIRDGAAILPEETFQTLGFTKEELEKYPNAKLQTSATPEFHAKHKAGRMALHDLRESLKAAPEE
jgi:hypothetical protein